MQSQGLSVNSVFVFTLFGSYIHHSNLQWNCCYITPIWWTEGWYLQPCHEASKDQALPPMQSHPEAGASSPGLPLRWRLAVPTTCRTAREMAGLVSSKPNIRKATYFTGELSLPLGEVWAFSQSHTTLIADNPWPCMEEHQRLSCWLRPSILQAHAVLALDVPCARASSTNNFIACWSQQTRTLREHDIYIREWHRKIASCHNSIIETCPLLPPFTGERMCYQPQLLVKWYSIFALIETCQNLTICI